MNYNRLGCDGAVSLGSLVKKNRSLTALHAKCNQIRGKGAAALARSLESAAKRTTGSPVAIVSLGGNPIDKSGARSLLRAAKACPNLQDFGLQHLTIHVGTKGKIQSALDENRRGSGGDGKDGEDASGVENIEFVNGENVAVGKHAPLFDGFRGTGKQTKEKVHSGQQVRRVGLYILGRPASTLA